VVISESCLISQYELNKCFRNLVFMGFFTSLYALPTDFIAHIGISPLEWKCPVTKSTTCQKKVLSVILQKGIFAMLPSRESIFLFSIFFRIDQNPITGYLNPPGKKSFLPWFAQILCDSKYKRMLNVYQDSLENAFLFWCSQKELKRARTFVNVLCIILEFSTFKCIKMRLYLSIVMNVSQETKLHDRFLGVV